MSEIKYRTEFVAYSISERDIEEILTGRVPIHAAFAWVGIIYKARVPHAA